MTTHIFSLLFFRVTWGWLHTIKMLLLQSLLFSIPFIEANHNELEQMPANSHALSETSSWGTYLGALGVGAVAGLGIIGWRAERKRLSRMI